MKYEYLVVDQDLRNLPMGSSVNDTIPSLLNAHGARGWQLDRFWDTQDGSARTYLLRKDSPRAGRSDNRILTI